MTWHLFVASRYLTAPRKEKFISLISLISALGVAVGVSALIIVIAVMSGFDRDLEEKMVGANAHILIEQDYGMAPNPALLAQVNAVAHVHSAAYFVHAQALVRRGDEVSAVVVRGVDPAQEARVTRIASYMKAGTLNLTASGAVIGSELARKLALHIGDEISLVSPAFVEGKRFIVRGIFTSGMYDYDLNLVYASIPQAQELFATHGMVSGIAVNVDGTQEIAEMKRALQAMLGPTYSVRTWMDLNRNLLAALKLEKIVMFIILTLIVLVACFNIASTLIMTVLEKTKDIGILKAIGARQQDVMAIFAIEGSIIGCLGTAIGTVVGVVACWCLERYHFIAIPSDIYYIDTLPVYLKMNDLAIIVVASICISFFATLYPSYRASRLDPVEALRYE